jgi:hypothetical protein
MLERGASASPPRLTDSALRDLIRRPRFSSATIARLAVICS